jgi:hypothetical protein
VWLSSRIVIYIKLHNTRRTRVVGTKTTRSNFFNVLLCSTVAIGIRLHVVLTDVLVLAKNSGSLNQLHGCSMFKNCTLVIFVFSVEIDNKTMKLEMCGFFLLLWITTFLSNFQLWYYYIVTQMFYLYTWSPRCFICTLVHWDVLFVHLFIEMFYLYTCSLRCFICTLVHWDILFVHLFIEMFDLYTCSLRCFICTLVHWDVLFVHLFIEMFYLYTGSLRCFICTPVHWDVLFVHLVTDMFYLYIWS